MNLKELKAASQEAKKISALDTDHLASISRATGKNILCSLDKQINAAKKLENYESLTQAARLAAGLDNRSMRELAEVSQSRDIFKNLNSTFAKINQPRLEIQDKLEALSGSLKPVTNVDSPGALSFEKLVPMQSSETHAINGLRDTATETNQRIHELVEIQMEQNALNAKESEANKKAHRDTMTINYLVLGGVVFSIFLTALVAIGMAADSNRWQTSQEKLLENNNRILEQIRDQ